MKVGTVEKDTKGKKYAYRFKTDIDITREALCDVHAAAKEAAAKSGSVPSKENDDPKAAKTEAAKGPAATEAKAAGTGAADGKVTPPSDAEKKETPPPADVKTLPAESATKAAAPAAEVKSESTPAPATSAAPAETSPAPRLPPRSAPRYSPRRRTDRTWRCNRENVY